ncbi:hypothetical protein [Caballeronia sp. TF1N1]|uniref:hypothetical protein n=1 Tax=Caballeronia sp. TF1N1 TaxID=2878153 RepID=UPI001FD513BE|nr:hypothetical protein [Caballeronia sp. TF1N1]
MATLVENFKLKIFPSFMTWFTVCCVTFFISGIFSGKGDVLDFPGIEVIQRFDEPLFIFIFPIVAGLFWSLIDAVSSVVLGLVVLWERLKAWVVRLMIRRTAAPKNNLLAVISGGGSNKQVKLMFAKESISQFIALGSIEMSISVLSMLLKTLVNAPILWRTIFNGAWPAMLLWVIALFWDWRLSASSIAAVGVASVVPQGQPGQTVAGATPNPSITPASSQSGSSGTQANKPGGGGAVP